MTSVRQESLDVRGTQVAVRRQGEGPPLLFLHGENDTIFAGAFLSSLAEQFEVIAPAHPGCLGTERSDRFRTVDDIAYLYLDLLEQLEGRVALVGASFGGWIAAEVATKCAHDLRALVLAAPLGIKVGDRRTRDFVDLYAVTPEEAQASLYASDQTRPDLTALDDNGFLAMAAAQEAFTFFGWQPYLHSPTLRARLGRIGVPTLVVDGAEDGFVLVDGYFDTYAKEIGANASRLTLPDAGHRIEEEAPGALSDAIVKFLGSV